MSDKTALGDRMKRYERAEAGRAGMDRLPLLVRLDGRAFSSWTRGLARPYDERLSQVMVGVMSSLVGEFHARIGYTQSDEITLVLHVDREGAELPFAGKFQKIASVLAGHASAAFNDLARSAIPERAGRLAAFDARAWNVPTLDEAANALLWRERDATKNSLSMLARAHYSHRDLMGKRSAEMHDMLHAKGVNWNDCPTFFKRGVFVRRSAVERAFTADEIESLPSNHAARSDPALTVTRTVLESIDMPPFDSVTNRVGVIFAGEMPVNDRT